MKVLHKEEIKAKESQMKNIQKFDLLKFKLFLVNQF